MTRQERSQMRPFGALTPFAEIRDLLTDLAVPIAETVSLELADATDRLLAADVVAGVDVPNADRAAMDGFALHSSTAAEAGATLRLAGRVAAGDSEAAPLLGAGECIEIATGAPLPAGADCVVPVERTAAADGQVVLQTACIPGQHVSRRAEDLALDQVVARAGARLHPSRLAACAAAGATHVEVWQSPCVRVMSSGDEVVPVGAGPLAPGQVFDSNATALTALFESIGCRVERTPIVGDDRAELVRVLQESTADLTVTVGGTSVGRRDLVSDAVAAAGEVLAHGAAVRPGKPLLLARVAGRPLIGLPGFPTSCLMMAYVTAVPVLRRMSRSNAAPGSISAVLGRDVESPADKVQFLPVQVDAGKALPTFTFSSAVSSMALADGWIEIPAADCQVAAGTEVEVYLY